MEKPSKHLIRFSRRRRLFPLGMQSHETLCAIITKKQGQIAMIDLVFCCICFGLKSNFSFASTLVSFLAFGKNATFSQRHRLARVGGGEGVFFRVVFQFHKAVVGKPVCLLGIGILPRMNEGLGEGMGDVGGVHMARQ